MINKMNIEQKKPYNEPCLTVLSTAPMQMLAVSGDPELRKTSEKADDYYEALTKEELDDFEW